jgi:hypothetical protein
MKRIWLNKARTIEEAQQFEVQYYSSMSGEERVETVQLLREMHFKTSGLKLGEDRKRLRRVLSVIKQT